MGEVECDQIILYKCTGLSNNLIENMKKHIKRKDISIMWNRTEENVRIMRDMYDKAQWPVFHLVRLPNPKWANSITRIQRDLSQYLLLEEHKK